MAQLKDLIVNGSSRLIGPVYGNLTGNADTATKATQDESGNNIKNSYASSLSISGTTVTLKNKNSDTLSTITVPTSGATGATGPQGPTGATGPAGSSGATGAAGAAALVYNGHTTLNPLGSLSIANNKLNRTPVANELINLYNIYNNNTTLLGCRVETVGSSTTSLILLNSSPLTGPTGATGAKGATGQQGPTGATGPAGGEPQAFVNVSISGNVLTFTRANGTTVDITLPSSGGGGNNGSGGGDIY